MGIPLPLIGEAVSARCLFFLKDERVAAGKILKGPEGVTFSGDKKAFVEDIKQVIYASKIISYAQAFMHLRTASHDHNWNLNLDKIAIT